MKKEEFLTWLDSYLNFEKTPKKGIFWLETMNFLCEKFGNPEKASPVFHIAGSKGKGSISCFISSILTEAGFKTGLYTSPHILSFFERITENGNFFSDDVYEKTICELKEKIEKIPLSEFPSQRPVTWFELVTLYAFLTFREAKTDFNVIETGLGGRLDSTNVVTPEVCCIGPIELEHTEFLGDTVEKIAGEKAGIIKKNTVVISARQSESVKNVFRKKALETGAEIFFIDEVLKSFRNNLKLYEKSDEILLKEEFFAEFNTLFPELSSLDASISLPGVFQCENALIACLAVIKALPSVSSDILKKGIEKAFLSGRFEIIQKSDDAPLLILDGAHTFNSVSFTMNTFNEMISQLEKKGSHCKCHLLFGCAADKEIEKIAPMFKGVFSSVSLTKPGNVKMCDIERMKKAFDSSGVSYEVDEDFENMILKSLKKAKADNAILLVTGSFYLVSEVKKILSKN